jgi:hypothetical protein
MLKRVASGGLSGKLALFFGVGGPDELDGLRQAVGVRVAEGVDANDRVGAVCLSMMMMICTDLRHSQLTIPGFCAKLRYRGRVAATTPPCSRSRTCLPHSPLCESGASCSATCKPAEPIAP